MTLWLDRCDVIVNNGMGEPAECGRTLPCDYHAVPAELDVEPVRAEEIEAAEEQARMLQEGVPNIHARLTGAQP